ncbi:tryptase gamma precursor-like [Tropilaelaps mercedesae]|uniref:Tryptase gamma-like n=1 Tax=Tropilaelaps mercedesae TaxID=418985 RepID=A0A1V9XAF0_9ACAR|nr:tryptase gamma precursor-like [Tropilaelaps mercedesae]
MFHHMLVTTEVFFVLIVVLAFPAVAFRCGYAKRRFSGRIAGGTTAYAGEFPWNVYIERSNNHGVATCGGSIISLRWILSSASCFTPPLETRDWRIISVTFGINRLFEIETIVVHPSYGTSPNLEGDIALVQTILKFPLRLSPICLPMKTDATFVGAKCLLLGYDRSGVGKPPFTIQAAEVNITANKECPVGNSTISDKQLCTIGPPAPCAQDYGGPLACRVKNDQRYHPRIYVLVGIVSFSDDCEQPGARTIYTRVSQYDKWILKMMYDFA